MNTIKQKNLKREIFFKVWHYAALFALSLVMVLSATLTKSPQKSKTFWVKM